MDIEITEKLNKHFSKSKLTYYKKGETLIGLTDEPKGVFYLKEGFVKMSTILGNGNELILNIYKPGSLFPLFWALGEVPNNYSFETMTNASLYKVSRSDTINFLKENSEVMFDVIKRILSGVDGLLTNYNHLLTGNSDSRVASAFLLIAKRFGEKTDDGKTIVKVQFTHQDIANLAGISRETASIAIGKLTKDKIMKQVKRRFVILDMDRLLEETAIENETPNDPAVI